MKETFYFSHDFNPSADPKIQAMIGEYGAVGYGLFWRIVEMLHTENDNRLQKKKYVYLALAKQMLTSVEQVEAFVNDCINVFELFESDEQYFWSNRVDRNLYYSHSKEAHWNWKGGITRDNHKIRNSVQMKFWRVSVFKRDKYSCQKCHRKGGKLQAHHIKEFAKFPELRLEISNGITLCKDCHNKIHSKK